MGTGICIGFKIHTHEFYVQVEFRLLYCLHGLVPWLPDTKISVITNETLTPISMNLTMGCSSIAKHLD